MKETIAELIRNFIRPDYVWALIFMAFTAAIIFVFLLKFAPTEKLYWMECANAVDVKAVRVDMEDHKQKLNNVGMMYQSMNERLNAIEGRKTDGKNAPGSHNRNRKGSVAGN